MSVETTSAIPGREHCDRADTLLDIANDMRSAYDETNPAADRAIAEAQARASMAIYEALTDIAAELSIIRKQHEPR